MVPERADPIIFRIAPYLSFVPAFITFSIVPIGGIFAPGHDGTVSILGHDTFLQLADPPIGILVALACSSVAVYGGLAFAGIRIARRVPDLFSRLAATAITAWIVVQAVVNIGAVIGILPITGVPLPLVSAGLSSLLVTLVALGMLMSFARLEPGAREALAARGPGWPLRVLSWLGLSKRRR